MEGQKIHMVGIGGIGMSALAQLYHHAGAEVAGSDREASPTTEMLEEKGIAVTIGQKAENVPADATLLVYSDAVHDTNPERAQAQELGIRQINYFEALGEAAAGKRVIAVAGTHGKTTTTAMLAQILVDAGLDPTVVVGSVVPAWGSNFRAGKSDLFVVEACEYRKHFLVFHPSLLVITNIEWDHTDYFKTPEEFAAAFAEARAQAAQVIDESVYKTETVPELLVPGEFNRGNARAAKAAARAQGVAPEAADASLARYAGTWRRFEYKGQLPGGATLYDDYAHHPTAIAKTLVAAREKFPDKKLVVFFHPHLYSRTRDLFADFAKALTAADQAYILPVYAAREPYDPTATHDMLAKAVNAAGGHAEAIADFAAVASKLRALGEDTVAFTMGAGDIYKVADQFSPKVRHPALY